MVLDGETIISNEKNVFTTESFHLNKNKPLIPITSSDTINDLVKNNLIDITKSLALIKKYEYFYATDVNFVQCIQQIENCDLIRFYYTDKSDESPLSCFMLHGTSNAMAEFVELYLKLKSFKIHTQYTVTTLASKEEHEKYFNDITSGKIFQNILGINNEWNTIYFNNPVLLIRSNHYNSKILTENLPDRVPLKDISFEDLSKITLSDYKYIIFVVDATTRKSVISFFNNTTIEAKILLLTEQRICRRGIKHKINAKNLKILDEIFFRSSFKLPFISIPFFKKEPSEKSILNIAIQIEDLFYGKHR